MSDNLLTQLVLYVEQADDGMSPADLTSRSGASRPTVNRALARLVQEGRLALVGAGRSTRYRLPSQTAVSIGRTQIAAPTRQTQIAEPTGQAASQYAGEPAWRPASRDLAVSLMAPLGTRTPVTYQRAFVERYEPNVSSLLPPALAAELHVAGRLRGQRPAGTYLRKVLEPLLIDLSWQSSHLEGNQKSLLDTRALFERGRSATDDLDATMLLNHKEAIEFLADAVPTEGMTVPVVRNVQSILMQGLMPDEADLGDIRKKIVHIQDSVYIPTQIPILLQDMLGLIVEKARATNNPVEAAFFLWVQLAYLQPFVDGNKRTSRLSANMPLLIGNCAPLSFLDVDPANYATAMLGVYEQTNVAIAVDLFEWTYRRSIQKYQVIEAAMGAPDPFRARLREALNDAIQQIVHHGQTQESTVAQLLIARDDRAPFAALLEKELTNLTMYNCARYRLPIGKTQAWIDAGRPR